MLSGYKKSLHQFFLKVHPDFFSRNREWQRSNERSVAQLNELLEWGKGFKNGILRPPPAPSLTIGFHLKVEEDGSGGGEVRGTFELPKPFHVTDAYKGPCERAVNKFLRDLLIKANCLDAAAEQMSKTQDDISASVEEAKKPLRRKPRVQPMKTLMEETSESLNETWYPESTPDLDDLIEADLLLFSRDISPKHCAFAMQTLQHSLKNMKYNLWYEVPLLVSHRYSIGEEVEGFISVPWDFEPATFVRLILERADDIKIQRAKLDDLASKIEQDIAVLCNACNLDDVIISCAHKESLPALDLLVQNSALLRRSGVSELSLEIGDKSFGFRKNGVVIFPKDMTSATLGAFLDKACAENRFEHARSIYATAKQLVEGIKWHLKEFREVIKPKGIDAFTAVCTYSQRLTWAMELVQIAPRLSQWDWSDFTFVLGSLDINWEKHVVMLPHDFNGDAVLKYIETTHGEAKQRVRDSLVEEEARRKGDEDRREMARGNPHEVPPPPVTPRVPQHIANQYITSKHDDELHVESPIQPRTTFESDADVKEYMQWEGAYRDPRALGKEAMAEEDDKERAFNLLNKKYREQAMKEILEEQNSRKNAARRKTHPTLGDLFGINDPKQTLMGMPLKVPGTKTSNN